MKCLAPEGPVYQAGTLSGNPLAMSAGIALISELQKTNPYEQLELTIQNFLNAISKSLETKVLILLTMLLAECLVSFSQKNCLKILKMYAQQIQKFSKNSL